MARKTNYNFDKRQREKQRMDKAEKKRLARLERKEARESGEITEDDTMVIAPIDPADLGLSGDDESLKSDEAAQ